MLCLVVNEERRQRLKHRELYAFIILDQFILKIDISIYDMSKRHLKLIY
jgi:hypothetical protein